MKAFFFAVALFLLLSITLQDSSPVTPTSCDATEPLAEKALDLVNKGRQDGYLFQLLRVADAHLDKAESTTVYYLVLDVEETDCSVLSRKHWHDCKPDVSRRPSEIVIGKCKVIATTHSNEHQDLKVKDFNCTTSSVSSALSNIKDSPVLLDFFEDTDLYREQADKALEKYKGENADFAHFRVDQVERVARARGEEGTNYYVDFSVRNCSAHYFPRHFNAFGFCRADLYYDVGASDLETPKDIVINCEVFNLEEHRNISGIHRLLGHLLFSNGHKHPPPGQSPFKANGSKHHHHSHKSHKPRCPAPGEDKSDSDRPVSHEGDLPSGSRCHHSHFSINGTRDPFIITIPVSTIPMDTIPTDTVPMDTIPMDMVPMDTIPMDMDTVPMDTIPMDMVPMDTVPIDIVTVDAVLTTVPMAMISMILDPVTHHPIAKVTITQAMAHLIDNQKREVQIRDTFTSKGDKLDMFTHSLH